MKTGLSYNIPAFAPTEKAAHRFLMDMGQPGYEIMRSITGSNRIDLTATKWVNLARHGVNVPASKVPDLVVPPLSSFEYSDVQLARQAFNSGKINLPVVMRAGGMTKVLSGAARMAYLQRKGIEPHVWLIDIERGMQSYSFDYVFSKVKELQPNNTPQTVQRILDDKVPHFNKVFDETFPRSALYMATDPKSKQPMIGIKSDSGPTSTYDFVGTYKAIGPLIDISKIREKYESENDHGGFVFKRVKT